MASPSISRWPADGKVCAALLLLLFAALWALFGFTPLMLDDYLFDAYWVQSDCLGDYAATVRAEENGRLANIVIGPWNHYLPHWVGSMLMAAICVGAIALTAPRRKVASLLLAAGAWIFLLPWRDNLPVSDIAMNYIPGSLMLLYLVRALCRRVRWLTVVVAFIAAQWHEMLTFALACAGIAFLVQKRLRLTPPEWFMVVAFIAGTAIHLSAPALWGKLAADSSASPLNIKYAIISLAPFIAAPAVALLLLQFDRKGLRRLISQPSFYLFFFAAMSAVPVLAVLGLRSRGLWYASVALLPCLVQMLLLFRPVVVRVLALASGIGLAIVLGASIYYSVLLNRENSRIVAEGAIAENGTVFADILPRTPAYTLRIPVAGAWYDPVQIACHNAHPRLPHFTVVPAALRDFRPVGTAPWQCGQYTVLPDAPLTLRGSLGEAITGRGVGTITVADTTRTAIRFTTPVATYIWLPE